RQPAEPRAQLRGRGLRRDERGRGLPRHRPDAPDVPSAARPDRTGARGRRRRRCPEVLAVDPQTLSIVERLGYVLAGSLFVIGLHRMNHPATARSGNQVSAAGMVIAVAITVLAIATGTLASSVGLVGLVVVAGVLIGGGLGLWLARSVQMTAIPQLVSLFNAVGGGAAALVAIDDFVRLSRTTQSLSVPVDTTVFVGLGAVMPVVTSLLNSFTGTAAAMAGFVIGTQGLIIAGALVGASGGILTRLMAQAMNRSIANSVLGGFGTGDSGGPAEAGPEGTVRQVG